MNSVIPVQPATRSRARISWGRVLSALAALFWLTLRQQFNGRRIWVLGALFALPVGLVVLLRSLVEKPPLETLEFAFLGNLLPHTLAPLAALIYGSGMIQDEVEEQTLTYLLLRPLPRPALYLTRFLATLVTTSLLVGLGAGALYVAIYAGTPELWEIVAGRLPRMAGILALGQVGYVALFAGLALLTRWSLLAGVVYIALIEGLLGNIDFLLRQGTVVYHFRVLVVRWLGLVEPFAGNWQREWSLDPEQIPLARSSVLVLVLAAAVLVLLSAWTFARREYGMKTPEGS